MSSCVCVVDRVWVVAAIIVGEQGNEWEIKSLSISQIIQIRLTSNEYKDKTLELYVWLTRITVAI